MLRTVRTVIVDEIHAVIGTRRGAHLSLSLERLQAIARQPLVRIGLSATQKPIEEVARFLVGSAGPERAGLRVPSDGRKAGNDGQKAGDDGRTVGDDGRTAGDDSWKADDDRRKAGDDGRKAGDDGWKAANDGRKAGDDGRKAGDDGRKAGDDGRTAGNDGRKPLRSWAGGGFRAAGPRDDRRRGTSPHDGSRRRDPEARRSKR
jgi:ATP-dependent Lhr-like helicase